MVDFFDCNFLFTQGNGSEPIMVTGLNSETGVLITERTAKSEKG